MRRLRVALTRIVAVGGSGIALTGRDLLRYGQLVLQRGRSGSHQIVPPEWVGAMTAPQFAGARLVRHRRRSPSRGSLTRGIRVRPS